MTRVATFLCLAIIGNPLFSRADIIYSNFGPGNTYVNDSGAVVDQSPSFQFMTSQDESLTEVDLVASLRSDQAVNQLTVELASDLNGHPGTLLASEEFDGELSLLGGTAAILQWLPSTQPLLTEATPYWLTLMAAPGNVVWNYNNQLQFGYSTFDGSSWQTTSNTLGALAILGSASTAPEPGTLALSGAAIAAALSLRRRRHRLD